MTKAKEKCAFCRTPVVNTKVIIGNVIMVEMKSRVTHRWCLPSNEQPRDVPLRWIQFLADSLISKAHISLVPLHIKHTKGSDILNWRFAGFRLRKTSQNFLLFLLRARWSQSHIHKKRKSPCTFRNGNTWNILGRVRATRGELPTPADRQMLSGFVPTGCNARL